MMVREGVGSGDPIARHGTVGDRHTYTDRASDHNESDLIKVI